MFDYTRVPLDAASQQIRLLILRPGDTTERVFGDLHFDSLERSPHYETLSYVWGSTRAAETVVVNDVEVQVTSNLLSALKRLRLRTRSRVLWIDQLCVDQSNNSEKATQISLMGEIYSGATGGLFWLGDLDLPLDGGLRYFSGEGQVNPSWKLTESDSLICSSSDVADQSDLDELAANGKSAERLIPFAFESLLQLSRAVPSEHHAVKDFLNSTLAQSGGLSPSLEAVLLVMRSDWWQRIWTLQECVLSYHALVIYGPYTMVWRKFLDATVFLHSHITACCGSALNEFAFNEAQRVVSATTRLSEIMTLRSQLLASKTKIKPAVLVYHLTTFQHRHATDDRDKVLGLLGLVSPWADTERFTINPGLPTAEVYQELAHKLLVETGSLDVLPHRVAPSKIPNLPSWAKDWSVTSTAIDVLSLQQSDLHVVCGSTKARVSLCPDIPGSLTLIGTPIANVIWTSEAAYDSTELWPNIFEKWLNEFNSPIESMLPSYNPFVRWRPRSKELFSLLCGHTVVDPDSPDVLRTACEIPISTVIRYIDPSPSLDGLDETERAKHPAASKAMNSLVSATIWERRMFGIDGLLGRRQLLSCGIGPLDIRQGDLVCILSGGKLPVVLRPVAECAIHSSRLHYKYLGTCFLEYKPTDLRELFEELNNVALSKFTLV